MKRQQPDEVSWGIAAAVVTFLICVVLAFTIAEVISGEPQHPRLQPGDIIPLRELERREAENLAAMAAIIEKQRAKGVLLAFFARAGSFFPLVAALTFVLICLLRRPKSLRTFGELSLPTFILGLVFGTLVLLA